MTLHQKITLLPIVLLLAAGCSSAPTQAPIKPATSNNIPANSTPVSKKEIIPVPASTSTQDQKTANLLFLPEIDPKIKSSIDDKGWIQKITPFPAITITYPSTGTYAVSVEHQMIKKDDPRLQGKENCFVTDAIKYKKIDFNGTYDNVVCQTTTDFDKKSGTRIDYFTLPAETGVHLITFKKKYTERLNMDIYSATIDHVIGIID